MCVNTHIAVAARVFVVCNRIVLLSLFGYNFNKQTY